MDLLHGPSETALAEQVRRDINSVSQETNVVLYPVESGDLLDFEIPCLPGTCDPLIQFKGRGPAVRKKLVSG